MFAKLLKHELRARAALLGLLCLAILGVAVLGGLVLRSLIVYEDQLNDLAGIGLSLSLIFMILAMIGCSVAIWVILLVRFYKNKFTDEGYLTFTLPVNSHQIFLSSFLSMLIWTVISSVVLVGGFALLGAIGISGTNIPFDFIFDMIVDEFSLIFGDLPADYWITYAVEIVLSPVYSIVLIMTCITVGTVIAKKHKVLAAFGIYYGISYLTSMISSIFTVAFSLQNMEDLLSDEMSSIYAGETTMLVIMIVWEVILIAAGYILSTQLMKRKLNLP